MCTSLHVVAAHAAPAHTHLTPAAPSASCSMNIHDRQAMIMHGVVMFFILCVYICLCLITACIFWRINVVINHVVT